MKYCIKSLTLVLPLLAACADAPVPEVKPVAVTEVARKNLTQPGALLQNGGFEHWEDGKPSHWTTIDSGIRVAPSADVVRAGETSAAVQVLTRTQKSTDLRQRIQVGAGTQRFSVWVMHTAGAVRARLYVDGYHVYSDASRLGQWQELSHELQVSADREIEVGLRFYGSASLSGSETVYVDDFQPSAQPVAEEEEEEGETCAGEVATLTVVTDGYASETSWELRSTDSRVEHSGGDYDNGSENVESLCLPSGDYEFTIHDSYGDGLCCSYGQGSYQLSVGGQQVAAGSTFRHSESTRFTVAGANDDGANDDGGPGPDLEGYYAAAAGLTGFELKTALHGIIADHQSRGYRAIWGFIDEHDRDLWFEADGSVLDIYSENPSGQDSYSYAGPSQQCGGFRGEGSCYNREHSFPKSWFGGAVEPMNSDIHHIFPTDGYVNNRRSSYPFGEVRDASFTSTNGSRLGTAEPGSGYSDIVFEPNAAFKGDLARAYFYLATRYEDRIAGWQRNGASADAVLDGSSDQVFEDWFLDLLIDWHQNDPVSPKESARNDAAFDYQGNRNPFVDHPELVEQVWGN